MLFIIMFSIQSHLIFYRVEVNFFLAYFLKTPTIFVTSGKKILYPNGPWTIYSHESGKKQKSLSVGNFGILSVVVALQLLQPIVVYVNVEAWSILYIILDYLNVTGFLIFETLCLDSSKHCQITGPKVVFVQLDVKLEKLFLIWQILSTYAILFVILYSNFFISF